MGIIYFLLIAELLGIIPIILIWKNDCKEIGKENLAVSLKERMIAYMILIIFPSIVGILY